MIKINRFSAAGRCVPIRLLDASGIVEPRRERLGCAWSVDPATGRLVCRWRTSASADAQEGRPRTVRHLSRLRAA